MSTDTHVPPGTAHEGDAERSVLREPGPTLWQDGLVTPAEQDVCTWLLTTTRSNRKTLDLDRPVEPEIVEECLRIALQAPSGHNDQRWHFLIITDPEKRAYIANIYNKLWSEVTKGEGKRGRRFKAAPKNASKVQDSANWLPAHLHEVPMFVIPCLVGPRYDSPAMRGEWSKFMEDKEELIAEIGEPSMLWLDGGLFASIYPAVWSFQLALRSRGLGSTMTVVHLVAEKRISEYLRLPSTVMMTCLLPVAHLTKHDFKPAPRAALETRLSYNSWGGAR